jgi:SAM-dependent methyltransferase
VQCDDCGLVFLNPQPNEDEWARISNSNGTGDASSKPNERLRQIQRYHGTGTGRLLELSCGSGDFLASAEEAGWQTTGIEYSPATCEQAQRRLKNGQVLCGHLALEKLAPDQFDLCVISYALEDVRSPRDFLGGIHRVLKPGGMLFATAHSATPWPDRSSRKRSSGELKAEHLTYFDSQTLQTALFKSNFRGIIVRDGMNVFARKVNGRSQPVLSVIVPAYNEVKTFPLLMDALLRKEIPGLAIEIIVVESNSTDGTRDLVQQYQKHPRVKLVLEDFPQGKGHAVRSGLNSATGDFVLIQDADLEYDLEDYDALLEPLIAGRTAFVLGSRHGGRNVLKMRQFAGEHGLSLFFNLGHWFFTALLNVLFLQKLRDPFTMFKIFRRDCLFGLEFECNDFDFDFELLIKLVRKGYRPIELPVNYRSRSFKEGKKVRIFRDPVTWLRALGRFRFVKIDPLAVVEQTHNRRPADNGQ